MRETESQKVMSNRTVASLLVEASKDKDRDGVIKTLLVLELREITMLLGETNRFLKRLADEL